jgi:hypothetical protein
MPHFICTTCGTQLADAQEPPTYCPICEDERQYINWQGQQWTTLETLQAERELVFHPLEEGLTALKITPEFAIGQNAHIIQTSQGNVLWECNSLIDNTTVERVQAMGGLSAIAISHPHFYSAMVEWSHAFGNIPIYLHESNRQYVARPDSVIHYWSGERFAVNDSITLLRCGGHFEGSSVLHWANGDGVLFTGDTIYVVQDRRYVSFMYSYPNMIPLSPTKVQKIVDTVETVEFSRLYSSWLGKVISADAKNRVKASAKRYIQHSTES